MTVKVTLQPFTKPTITSALKQQNITCIFKLPDMPAVLAVSLAIHKHSLQHDGYPDRIAVSLVNYREYQAMVCPGWTPCYIVGRHLVWLVEDASLDNDTLITYQQPVQGCSVVELQECKWML